MPRQRTNYTNVNVGDKVGLSITRVNRQHEVVGTRIVTTGIVTRLYRDAPGRRWKIEVKPSDKARWFLYTGHDNWAYLHEVTLVARARANKQTTFPKR